MSSEVYFAQRRATQGGGLLVKLEQLFDAAGFGALAPEGGAIAVKVPFAARGNTTHLRPQYLERLVSRLRQNGLEPFLTDTRPPGVSGVSALLAAHEQGFGLASVKAPLVLADGVSGADEVAMPDEGARVAGAVARAEGVLAVAHFTGHEVFGFAGALWTMGFGAASRAGKAAILGDHPPKAPATDDLSERLVAYALAATAGRRVGYLNILVDVTPHADDQGWSDASVVPDIGILASRDPVALDQASIDLLNQAPGIPGTRLTDAMSKDKLRDLNPQVDWEATLRYAERVGLGKRDYELMII